MGSILSIGVCGTCYHEWVVRKEKVKRKKGERLWNGKATDVSIAGHGIHSAWL